MDIQEIKKVADLHNFYVEQNKLVESQLNESFFDIDRLFHKAQISSNQDFINRLNELFGKEISTYNKS